MDTALPSDPSPELRDIPIAEDTGELPLDLLTEPLRAQIDWVQRRYGLDPVAACLATLVSVQCSCGPSRRVLSPIDDSLLPPAFSFVLHGDTINVAAAVNLSLDPLRRWLLGRIGHPDKRDVRRFRLRLADLHQERIALEHQLRANAPGTPTGLFGVADENGLAKRRGEIRDNLEKNLRDTEATSFLLLPYTLVDDAPVSQLLAPGRLSLDGAVLAASLSGDAIPAWTAATGPEKTALARLLSASWRGWPQVGDEQTHAFPLLSAVLVTEAEAAHTLWQDKGLAALNRHLFFVENDADATFDLDAEHDSDVGDFCATALHPLIDARLEGRVVNHVLNQAATAHFQTFLNKTLAEAKGLAPDEKRRLERSPLLALKLALLIHIVSPGQGDETMDVPTVEFACRLADVVCVRDSDFIRQTPAPTPTGRVPKQENEEAQLSDLVEKLRLRGPLRWRRLLRGTHRQQAEPLQKLLTKGIAAGLIGQEGDSYWAIKPAATS